MIHPSPPRPPPRTFYSYLFVTFMINFSTWYISHIFSSWNSNRLGPCVFSAHIKIQKGHIIKTHNCCESIKRVGTETERREKKRKRKFWGKQVRWQMYCTSVCFTLQPDGESTESLPVLNVWMNGHIRRRSTTRHVYKINPSSSRVLLEADLMEREK